MVKSIASFCLTFLLAFHNIAIVELHKSLLTFSLIFIDETVLLGHPYYTYSSLIHEVIQTARFKISRRLNLC